MNKRVDDPVDDLLVGVLTTPITAKKWGRKEKKKVGVFQLFFFFFLEARPVEGTRENLLLDFIQQHPDEHSLQGLDHELPPRIESQLQTTHKKSQTGANGRLR